MARRNLLARAARSGNQRLAVARARRRLVPDPGAGEVTWVGTSYGGWALPAGLLEATSICYLAGVGEDASFDLALIERFGCEVHAFDPVPEAIAYANAVAQRESRFHFHPFGLWSADGVLSFHDNPDEGFVSRSATDMHGTTGRLELDVRSIPGVLAELGHDHVDLLKLSVEGSEYELIDALIAEGIRVDALCVEFAQPAPLGKVEAGVERLRAAGWRLEYASIQPFNWKLTLRATTAG